jgi:hypothetical protein
MVVLAAIPSSSVALVVLRSASLGVRSGVATAFGIAAGDLIFVALAISGRLRPNHELSCIVIICRAPQPEHFGGVGAN